MGLGLAVQVSADSNGMDMSMDGPMALAEGQMLPYLHFTTGDNLFFLGWVPKSTGAMIGACIALFLLAIIERWIAACRSLMEAHWRKRSKARLEARHARTFSTDSDEKDEKMEKDVEVVVPVLPHSSGSILSRRNIPPFVPSQDIVRGIVFVGQAALGYAFMLAIMTFQAGFIISIAVGLGVGETLFGRYHEHAHL
ncbi:hypothetical protein SCHPADRAFT_819296 [Schizopora paradoxa]|uniref:Copper transport protein n=1 Tax=Schizopora paradoxa TaxID=27342 RepID=A0A0H2S3X3_9AGAM|nr:hypothetical protein SCHPADRAFT_819296 [Schizopora paradoxa]